ncbi:TetR/AcrR family transcriptional regulator [Longimicrobium sp.]|jgi:AcrR family transcriptional regulator|uniref:TetR/AcrR family transcriptional regulator n=1 Tax=Longimicrobium sp. TaxID=2029185 RepID=UPI002F92E2E7
MSTDERSAYDEKLESILRAAAAIFAEKGYHQASIRDIARSTGVSLSGLYYYFNSKEELLFLIQDHAFGTLLNNLERLLAGEEQPHRRLRLLMENHLRYFIANTAEMKVLSHEAEALTGDFRRRVNAKKRRLTEIAMEILGEIRPAGDVDLRVATFAMFGMMNWLYNWHRADRDVPLDKIVDDMYRIFLEGFQPAGAKVPALAREAAPGESRPSIWRSGADE